MKKLFTILFAFVLVLPFCMSAGNSVAQAEEVPVWEKTYYVDVFGDSTGEWYITNKVPFSGTFKNSATDGSPLSAKILVDFDSASIVLYEYGKDRVKNTFSNDVIYNIAIKTAKGTKYTTSGTLSSGSDRIRIVGFTNSLSRDLIINALDDEGAVSFYIERSDQPLNNYLFKAECGNFGEVFRDGYYQMAIQYLQQNMLEEAIQTKNQYLGTYKDIQNQFYIKAVSLRESGRFQDSIAIFRAIGDYRDSEEQINITYYEEAEAFRRDEKYDKAISAFERLGDYRDSREQVKITQELCYAKAVTLRENNLFDDAIAAFQVVRYYKDSKDRIKEAYYQKGTDCLTTNDIANAAIAFGLAGSYLDARTQSLTSWDQIAQRSTIAAGDRHSVAVCTDGTVVAVGKNDLNQCNVSGWKDVIAVSAGSNHTVGLKSNGTLYAIGNNASYQCNIGEWKNIVAIAAGGGHTVGLRKDGTVVAVGWNKYGQCDVDDWTDIIAIAAGSHYTVGLKANGTVVAVGDNADGRCNVGSWKNIVSIAATGIHTVGLKPDGTVVAVGFNNQHQCDVKGWTNISAIAAGGFHTVGLRADGSVAYTGNNSTDSNTISGWSSIVSLAGGGYHTIGLRSNGSVVATGLNTDGQCDVSGWTTIKLPSQ